MMQSVITTKASLESRHTGAPNHDPRPDSGKVLLWVGVFRGDINCISQAKFEMVCHSADTQESVETVGASFFILKQVRGTLAPPLE
jgi:hypothetical protein